jgi:hypothetical protein
MTRSGCPAGSRTQVRVQLPAPHGAADPPIAISRLTWSRPTPSRRGVPELGRRAASTAGVQAVWRDGIAEEAAGRGPQPTQPCHVQLVRTAQVQQIVTRARCRARLIVCPRSSDRARAWAPLRSGIGWSRLRTERPEDIAWAPSCSPGDTVIRQRCPDQAFARFGAKIADCVHSCGYGYAAEPALTSFTRSVRSSTDRSTRGGTHGAGPA